jgi:hypothetical protein
MKNYPLLDVRVSTPVLELRSATDDLLDQLADVVRAGKTHADPPPYDDPMSFYETDPDLRVAKWLRAIWRRRGTVEPDAWRLYFVVMVDGRPVGEQTMTGVNFSTLGNGHDLLLAVHRSARPWPRPRDAGSDPAPGVRRPRDKGSKQRRFVDNHSSDAISRGLGYEPNGSEWATRQGEPALLNRWRLTRDNWQQRRRTDIHLHSLNACHTLLPLC